MNGADFPASEAEYQELVLGVAEGRIDKSGAIGFLQQHVDE